MTTDKSVSPVDAEARLTAEVIPFPISRTETGRFIAAEYARRPVKGRYTKAAYAEGVLKANAERLQRLGVAQERIEEEMARLRELFWRLDGTADEKVRA